MEQHKEDKNTPTGAKRMDSINFSDEYVEQVFFAWYKNNKMGGKSFVNRLAPDSRGRTPSATIVKSWMITKGWMERADAMDAEASMALTKEVIDERIQMFRRHAEVGQELIERGMKYLLEHGIDNSQAAIRAIDIGVATQRISTGQAEMGAAVLKMRDSQLDKELPKLL